MKHARMAATIAAAAVLMTAGSAAAQLGGAPNGLTGSAQTLNARTIQLDDATKMALAIDRLTRDVAALQTKLAATETRAAGAETKAEAAQQKLAQLTARFDTHKHWVMGKTGRGILSATDGDGKVITFLTPWKNDEEERQYKYTGGPSAGDAK